MDRIAKNQIIKFYKSYKNIIKDGLIADLGSYNVNGSVKEILNNFGIQIVGFDILEGKGVDVYIEPGKVPDEHYNKYIACTVIQSFQFCPRYEWYKKEILNVLKPGGLLLLITCTKKCKIGSHSSSPNKFWTKGLYLSWTKEEIIAFFSDSFNMIECYTAEKEKFKDHSAYVYIGEKK